MRSVAFAVVGLAACTGGQGPGSFDPPFEQTRQSMALVSTEGTVSGFTTQVTGTRDVGGTQVPVVTAVDPRSGPDAAVEVVISVEGTEFTLGGITVPHRPPGLGIDLVFEQPATFELAGPIGEPQTITIDGSLTFGDPEFTNPGYLPFDMTLVPEEEGVVAPAPMGDIPGCRRATVTLSTSGIAIEAEIWTHDDLGIVHGVVDAEPWGTFEMGTEGWTGFADAGGVRLIQAEQILDASRPSFSLSTFDIDGDFLADKNVHAQMWLELRFADADRARTEDRPAVTETFGTVFGYFPSMLVRADASVLHPDDADEGFVYWIAAVDQAAKNEPENGIAYSLSASWSGGDPVHAAAFIRYTRID